ncbi:MAG: hypothetical protein MZV64_36925 [Ignavibacteriales bacterium]|nr:hypothetical protein [Ignavibacteriales bacterium]
MEKYGIEYTGFPDDLPCSDKAFVMETCSLLEKGFRAYAGRAWAGLRRLTARCASRAMRRAGCDWISYLESGSPEMLRRMAVPSPRAVPRRHKDDP